MKKTYTLALSTLFAFLSFNCFSQAGWTVYNNANTPALPSSTYKAVAFDQNGNLWAGGSYTGLFKFDGTTWTGFTTTNSNILHSDINDIVVDNSNKVWAANYKGISVYSGSSTFTNYDTANSVFTGMTVYKLGKDLNGGIWISSRNGSFGYQGITVYDGSNWSNLTGYPSQINGAQFSDYAFSSGNVAWLACNNGLAKYSGGAFTYYTPGTSMSSSEKTAVDASGNIWAGGFDCLLKYDGSTWTKYDNITAMGFASSNTLYYDIFPDGNILWIATSGGLVKFNRLTGVVLENYKSTNSPLADNCVTQIAKDASGNLWLSSTIGIVKMDATIVGLDEKKSDVIVNVFPNPTKEILNIEIKDYENTVLEILSVEGKVLKKVDLHAKKTAVDVSAITSGIYSVKIISGEGISIKKFVKE